LTRFREICGSRFSYFIVLQSHFYILLIRSVAGGYLCQVVSRKPLTAAAFDALATCAYCIQARFLSNARVSGKYFRISI